MVADTTRYPGLAWLLSTPLVGFGPTAAPSTVGPVWSTTSGMSSSGPHRPSESWLLARMWWVPSDSAWTVLAAREAVSETTDAVRLRAMVVPVPGAPAVSRKYSAAVIVPPAAVSSPVAATLTRAAPAGLGLAEPLVVDGPVLGRLRTTDPTAPQLPAASRARTNTWWRPASRESSTAVLMLADAPATVGEP